MNSRYFLFVVVFSLISLKAFSSELGRDVRVMTDGGIPSLDDIMASQSNARLSVSKEERLEIQCYWLGKYQGGLLELSTKMKNLNEYRQYWEEVRNLADQLGDYCTRHTEDANVTPLLDQLAQRVDAISKIAESEKARKTSIEGAPAEAKRSLEETLRGAERELNKFKEGAGREIENAGRDLGEFGRHLEGEVNKIKDKLFPR